MSIIIVDYEDAYERAEVFGRMSETMLEMSKAIENDGIKSRMSDFSKTFAELQTDIRAGADVWEEFYRHNIRL